MRSSMAGPRASRVRRVALSRARVRRGTASRASASAAGPAAPGDGGGGGGAAGADVSGSGAPELEEVPGERVARVAAWVGGGTAVTAAAALAREGRRLREERVASVAPNQVPPSANEYYAGTPLGRIMMPLIILQGVLFSGAIVAGRLARTRRRKLEHVNSRLRRLNAELMRERHSKSDAEIEAEEDAAMLAQDLEQAASGLPESAVVRAALEASFEAPAAAHPEEVYGSAGDSLAVARRRVRALLADGRGQLEAGNSNGALEFFQAAETLAKDAASPRAALRALRLQAQALGALGRHGAALQCLQQAADGLKRVDANLCGEIADCYAEMGDLERAAEWYDRTIEAVAVESNADDTDED